MYINVFLISQNIKIIYSIFFFTFNFSTVAMTIKSSKMSSTASTVGRDVEAREYLEQHRVLELFNNMTSQLIYNRPGRYLFL